jgi:hypothetical protein
MLVDYFDYSRYYFNTNKAKGTKKEYLQIKSFVKKNVNYYTHPKSMAVWANS